MRKRLLSMLLAIAMLATLLPTVPLVGAADGYTFVYDFNPNQITSNDISVAHMETYGSSYEGTHQLWQYHSKHPKLLETSIRGYVCGKHYVTQIQSGSIDRWVALELNVPVAGEYTVTHKHGAHKVGSYANIYLLPPGTTDIETAIADDTYKINFDYIDYYQNTTGAVGGFSVTFDKKFTVTEQTKGKWICVIYCAEKNANVNMYPGSIELSSGSGALPMDLSASFEDVLSVGASANIAFTGYMSDGTELSADKVERLTCTSRNPGVATVDNKGKITGVSAGETVIEISATTAGITLTDEVTVTVDSTMIPNGNTFVYDLNPDLTKDVMLSTMTIEDTRGMWLWADATKNLKKTDTHTISGVEANNSVDGEWFAVKINVPVAGKYQATLTHSRSNSSGGYGNVYILPSTVNIADVIDSSTPVGGEVAYYSIPGKTDVETELGTVTLDTAGEYYLVFRSTRKGEGIKNHATYPDGYAANNRMYPHILTLSNGENRVPMLVKASFDMHSLRINEKGKLSVNTYMSDKTQAGLEDEDVVISYVSKNPEIAVVDEYGEVMGIAAGNAEIEISVTSNGVTKSATATVSVSSEVLKFSDYTLMYDFTYDMKKIANVAWDDITETHTRNFWMPHSLMPGLKLSTLRKTSYGLQIGTHLNQFVAITLNVPVAGVYKTNVGVLQGVSGGQMAMYIVDGDAEDLTSSLSTAQKIGTFNCYASATTDNVYVDGNNIEFKKPGKYILIVNNEGLGDGNGNGKSGNMYLKSVKFTGGSDIAVESLFVSKDRTELVIGETDAVSVNEVYLSNCTVARTGDYTVEYKSSDSSIATVDAEGNIKAIGLGDTVVTVTAKRGESIATREVMVSVLPETYSGFTSKYDFSTTEVFKDSTFASTHNLWSYNDSNTDVTVNDDGIIFGTDAQSEASVTLNVFASGEYQVRVSHSQNDNGAVGAIYVDGTKVGTIDYSADSAENKLSVINLTAGEHTLAFKYESGDGFVQSPAVVTLYGGQKFAPADADIVFANNVATVTKVYLSDGTEILPSNAVIRYRLQSEFDAVIDIESGVVTAGEENATGTVTAEVTFNGVTYKESITVNIIGVRESEYTLVYDFREVNISDGAPLKGVDYDGTNGFWKYHGAKVESTGIKTASYGFYLTLSKGNWAALKIYVPAPGRYTTRLDHLAGTSGGIGEIHILPADTTDIEAAITSGMSQNLGSANFFVNGTSTYPQTTLRDVTFFEKGEYILVFRSIEQGELGSANLYPQQIVFNAAKKNPTIQNIFVKDYELCIGEDVSIDIEKIYFTDYTEAVNGSYKLSVISENPEVAVVNGNVLSGVSEGTVALDITATRDDVSITKRSTVKVLEVGSSGYTFNYNFTNSKASEYKSSTYVDTYNFWKFAETDAKNISVSANGVRFGAEDESYVAYEINVPIDGKYRASVSHGNGQDGATASIYVGKSIDGASKVGTIDYSTGNLTTIDELEFERAGNYYVIFKNESNDGKIQYPVALNLVGGSRTILVGVEVKADGYGAEVVGGIMSDGKRIDLSGAYAEFSLSNLKAGTINTMTGKITASEQGGKSNVVASVIYEDVMATGEIEVTIPAKQYEIAGTSAYYRFNERSADWMSPYGTNAYDIRKITREFNEGNWAWWGASPEVKVDSRSTICYAYPSGESVPRLRMITYQDEWVAFEIDVSAPGAYNVSLESAKSNRSNSGESDIYILPLEDGATSQSVDAKLNNETYVGTVSFFDGSVSENKWINSVTDNLGMINFDKAGKYLVVFEQNKTDIAKELTMKSLVLTGASNVLSAVDFVLEKNVYSVGETGKSSFAAYMLDGAEVDYSDVGIVYTSSDESVATVIDGVVTAVGMGMAKITLSVICNGYSIKTTRTIFVTDDSGTAGISIVGDNWGFVEEDIKLSIKRVFNSGGTADVIGIPISFTIVEGDATIVNTTYVRGNSAGTVKVAASVKLDGVIYTSEPFEIEIRDRTQKDGPTYYTYERREAARENMKTYDWASAGLKQTINTANKYLETYEYIYDHMTGEGLPRSQRVGEELDPEYKICRYCGVDTVTKYGSGATGGYSVNVYSQKWKIQCKECKRIFPSNDFGLLYDRGIDEYGLYDRERAIAKNAEAVANGEKDALKNDLYPELWTAGNALYNKDPLGDYITWNGEQGADLGTVIDPSTGEEIIGGRMWAVDDGVGYMPGRKYANGCDERHGYIAYYVHKLWDEVNYQIRWFDRGYIFTGDERYGRAGAILMDRLSDLYPTFSQKQWDNMYLVSHGGSGFGKIFGCINDCEYVTTWAQDADAFYPIIMADDPQVISFLSKKQQQFGFKSLTGNTKTSGEKIWANIENGLLREIFRSVQNGNICGNYGQAQKALAAVALVLDNEPESNDIVEYLYRPGSRIINGSTAHCAGGNLSVQFFDVIDRDGMGNEAAPNYNLGWIADLYECADMLNMYTEDPKYDLYQNPKYAKMFTAAIPVVLTDDHTAQIGDTSWTASIAISGDQELMINGFKELKDTNLGNELAEFIYRRNGYTEKGLHYDYFTPDPESLQRDILARIDGDLTQKSEMMPAYGFAILRGGAAYGDNGLPTYRNNMRDFWIYFGRNSGHGHSDALNLGIEAYGLNMAPDNGTPEVKSTDANRSQWVEPTIAHNTVTVDESEQNDVGIHGYPKHFDDAGDVKVMDIDASKAYNVASIYRRTLVMINAGDDVSYGVDFFRVKGGNDHIYSFHSQSDEIFETVGLENMTYQTDDGTATGNYIGSYAGPDVPYGKDPSGNVSSGLSYPKGYTWMKNIRRTANVNDFEVDFKVTDFRGALKDGKGLHLRMTMLNGFELQEVALTSGYVIQTSGTTQLPKTFEYVIARRKGNNLDSLFTTVFEPYRNTRYISDMSAVNDISIVDGSEGVDDEVRAVKVVRTDGRVDYIVYATNNDVLYRFTDDNINFNFRGFVGVYSLNADGVNIYNYVHDGDVIGEKTGLRKAFTGNIVNFTNELTFDNSITVKPNTPFDAEQLSGKYVFVENDTLQNAVYKIESAENIDGFVKLNIGATTTIRSLKDSSDNTKGYVYNVERGQRVFVPVSNVDDNGPVFDKKADVSGTAGSQFETSVNAKAADDASVAYIGSVMPRGAMIDETTGRISWKPDSSQIGDNHFAITAIDSYGRERTIHFIVSIYGSTTSTGKVPTPSTPGDHTIIPTTPGAESSNSETPEGKPETGENKNVHFIDLGNHTWAADSINALADEGIIKGTTSKTFSPANNITRADFAILLVRAFKMTSNNAENFDDVQSGDYFASELAVARNTGLVNGIGENKFAPRNNITRQDMMVIVYRAMKEFEIEFKTDEISSPDFEMVSDYAKDAVAALVNAELVTGKNGFIAPNDYTTRAEVAVLLKRILDYVNK